MDTIDPAFVAALREIVGDRHVLTDDDLTERYRTDWTRRFVAPSATVVRPSAPDEVSAIIGACRGAGVAVAPQGGNTGLVGGSVPLDGEIVLSTERITGVSDVGHDRLVAGAGTTLAEVQMTAARNGRSYGVDIASRASATIGGTVATNAGGLKVIRNGGTRRQVLGVEVVTGTGDRLSSIGGPVRDNTGYHLPSLITGSEGTLGVITAVEVRLLSEPTNSTVALVRFDDVSHAAVAAESTKGLLPTVAAVELFLSTGLDLVTSTFDLPAPFATTAGAYLLLENTSDDDPTPDLATAVDAMAGVQDAAVADSPSDRARLWKYRELHTDAIATLGVTHKLDVALPPGALAQFLQDVPRVIAEVDPRATTWLFGHAGEGSIHVNVSGLGPEGDQVDGAVLALVAELRGSISAEHGIGRAKLPWLHLARDDATIRALQAVKSALDPDGILNPAVLLPQPRRS